MLVLTSRRIRRASFVMGILLVLRIGTMIIIRRPQLLELPITSSDHHHPVVLAQPSKLAIAEEEKVTPEVVVAFEYHTPQTLQEALKQSIMKHHNVLCADLAEWQQQPSSREALPSPPALPIKISFRMNCQELFSHSIFGTGNVLWMLYNTRLVARLLGNVHVEMECSDAVVTASQLVLPWMMGSFPATTDTNNDSSYYTTTNTSLLLKDACLSLQPSTVHIIREEIQYELRRMALRLVGIPYPGHPAAQFALDAVKERQLQVPIHLINNRTDEDPFVPNAQIDDAVIHFRCGDIIEKRAHRRYRYVRWSLLAQQISPEVRSIGIVTQPTVGGQTRPLDRSNGAGGRCWQLLEPMQAYFQTIFPHARIRIRNEPDETIALAFTRFIMANQSLAGGFSTFYIMPFYATFGTAYDVDEADPTMISSGTIMELWEKEGGVQQIVELFTK